MVAGPPGGNRNDLKGSIVGSVVQAGVVTFMTPGGRPTAVAGLPTQSVFIGREGELSRLVDALHPDSPDAVLVWSLGGLPGVGKTALAVCAAHKAVTSGWFPGGVVMANLRGYDLPSQRVSASAALASLLGALGAASEEIPPDVDDRARLWRSMLAGRSRMLIIVDNLSEAAQVEPLLPGIGDHKVLITSRHRLAGLDNTRLLDVDVLEPADAVKMLSTVIEISDPADCRAVDDPESTERVANLCGRLPLAVRVAAAQLVADPERTMADMAEALEDERSRLAELNYDGSLAVRAAFDLLYAQLDPAQAQLLRLTALDPGPHVSVEAMAAIAGIGLPEARRLVQQLRAAHLLQPWDLSGRWRMHDLVRLYAAEKAADDPDREQAIVRLLDYYVYKLRTAGSYLTGQEAHTSPQFVSRHDAYQQIVIEANNLVAAVDFAHSFGHLRHVVQLTTNLSYYLRLSRRHSELVLTHRLALAAVRAQGDRRTEATLLRQLGLAYLRLLRTDLAMDHFRQAIRLSRLLGDRAAFGQALNRLGEAYRHVDKLAAAMVCHRWVLELARSLGDWSLEGDALFDIATVHRIRGEYEQAILLHQQDLATLRAHEHTLYAGRVLDAIGVLYRQMGRIADAIDCHQQNIEICREVVDVYGEALARGRLAIAYREDGQLAEAVRCHTEALRTLRTAGPRHHLGTELKELGTTYATQGRIEEARQCLAEAVGILAGYPTRQLGAVAEQARAELTALSDQA
jgi:tetratricopeptide (TPR) repeat protein